MAIDPSNNSTIGTRITPPDADYPQGSSRDEQSPGARDGTPLFSERSNDIFGLQQALLRSASITPTGNADTALASQYMQSIVELASGRAVAYDDVGVADAYVLDVRTNQQAPASLFDGLIAVFSPLNPNTGASTVNVTGFGVKNIVDTAGNPLGAGVLIAGNRVELAYELGADRFVHINPFDGVPLEVLYDTMLGNNIIPVYTEADIGVAVAGELTLADNTTYHIMAPIVTANTWILGNRTHVMDPSYTNNPLTFVGANAFKVDELILVRISNINIFSNGAAQLFDFTSTAGGSLSMDRCIIAGMASLGHLTGLSTAWQRLTFLDFAQGLICDGGTLLAIDFTAMQTDDVVTVLDIKGTWTGPLSLSKMNLESGVGGFALDVDAAIIMPVMRLRDIGFPGTFFDPTGLDGTAINIQTSGLDGIKASEVIGIMSMSGNAVETTIATQNVYVSIAGTTVAGVENERITHSGNILTYIGLEPISAKIHMVSAAVTASATNLYDFGLFKNDVLIPNALMRNDLSGRSQTTPLEFIVSLVTGDTIEIKVQNTENVVNLTVSDFIVTLAA